MSKRDIPSLDGLRAVSIGLVILSHAHAALPALLQRLGLDWWWLYGSLGVSVFFVISGYLITKILLSEFDLSGTISLKRFYFRRSFRIFPAFYVFLAVVGTLWAFRVVQYTWPSFLAAATYTWNYYPHTSAFTLGHVWSLSLEEQFYLLWPLVLLMCGKRRALWVASGIILAEPFIRTATYFVAPAWRAHIWMMLHTRIDTILFGCVLALATQDASVVASLKKLCHPVVLTGAGLFLLVLSPWLWVRYHGVYLATVGLSAIGAALVLLVFYGVHEPESWYGRFLNFAPIRHLGAISYSIYLWQQLISGDEPVIGFSPYWIRLVVLLAIAETSYWAIEKPFLRLRQRLEREPEPKQAMRKVATADGI